MILAGFKNLCHAMQDLSKSLKNLIPKNILKDFLGLFKHFHQLRVTNCVRIQHVNLPAVQLPCEHQPVQGIQLLYHWMLLLFSSLVIWTLKIKKKQKNPSCLVYVTVMNNNFVHLVDWRAE